MNKCQPSSDTGRSRGFTLIELLVVIAIISLLASILLPSLNRARDLTKRTVCAANQRHVTLAYTSYASEYNSYVPVGYWSTKQFNYPIYGAGGPGFIIFGGLYLADLMPEPKAFYCPTNTTDIGACFNTDSNRWPPGSGGTTRAGYGSRPEVNWRFSKRVRLHELGSKAVVADFASAAGHVAQRHKDGVNAGYGDGAVSWVARSLLDEDFEQMIGGRFTPANNVYIENIWETFDEQH
ncbi:MAG: type II secretion system GspH family protein [Phycisphaerae bacterium]|nr:type II secretion system GspH family protein [Phycisphaerae bacterium]